VPDEGTRKPGAGVPLTGAHEPQSTADAERAEAVEQHGRDSRSHVGLGLERMR
jgi:hypothetical protein